MPYIKTEDRPRLDQHIDALADEIKAIVKEQGQATAFAGLLNYAITRLVLQVIPERRYWAIATVSGVLHNVLAEFYRRYAVPYEDEQIKKAGDVYPQ